MIEMQSGQYLGEDDVVRFDDIYGRSISQKSHESEASRKITE
ncbi:hypothetical protein [Coxiella endosymbiont of Amblyomma nuttalli]|nr:hypothetical protein [Coxiella endosymbiont of Amblyomma nuttalli]QTS84149.1 hypothetical protein CEAn_00652 [Coxiella endosymbiont of Amblyomma nuttalli]